MLQILLLIQNKLKRRIKKNKDNYITLPTIHGQKVSPEKVLHEFLFSEAAQDYFKTEKLKYPLLKKEYFEEYDVEQDGNKKERVRYKEWFNRHKDLFEKTKIFNYWKDKNRETADDFKQSFLEKLERISKICY